MTLILTTSNRWIRCIVAALVLLCHSSATDAQPGAGLLAVPLIGEQLPSILDHFEEVAQRLLATAASQGDGLIGRAGEQIDLQIGNLRIMLEGQEGRFFKDLDPTVRNTLGQLNDFVVS